MSISTHAADWFSQIDHQLQQPAVRALAYAIGSPALLRHWPDEFAEQAWLQQVSLFASQQWQQHFQDYWPRLLKLDRDPQPLLTHLAQLKSSRLGLYFEQLIGFWLTERDYHPYELVCRNWQQFSGQQTIGEVDVLVNNQQTRQLEHWELAIKFYLGDADLTLPQHWRGLNRRDHLQRKLQRMLSRQFTLTHFADEAISCRKLVLKGRFFYPDTVPPAAGLIDWLDPDHPAGYWGYGLPAGQWLRARRPEWLMPDQLPMHVNGLADEPATTITTVVNYHAAGLYWQSYEPDPRSAFVLRMPGHAPVPYLA